MMALMNVQAACLSVVKMLKIMGGYRLYCPTQQFSGSLKMIFLIFQRINQYGICIFFAGQGSQTRRVMAAILGLEDGQIRQICAKAERGCILGCINSYF
ncbi:hypothetical protein [Alysiella crassa]|nr:hypothetical protein [Alysiella crassa]